MAAASQDPTTSRFDSAYVQPSPAPVAGVGAAPPFVTPADPTRDLLIYAGLAIATLSLGVLALAWAARRYFTDPLVR